MFKLELENQKRNVEIQNQVCLMMRDIQENCYQTLGTYILINVQPVEKILEDSCLS